MCLIQSHTCVLNIRYQVQRWKHVIAFIITSPFKENNRKIAWRLQISRGSRVGVKPKCLLFVWPHSLLIETTFTCILVILAVEQRVQELLARGHGSFGTTAFCTLEPGTVVLGCMGQPLVLAVDNVSICVSLCFLAANISCPCTVFEMWALTSFRSRLENQYRHGLTFKHCLRPGLGVLKFSIVFFVDIKLYMRMYSTCCCPCNFMFGTV